MNDVSSMMLLGIGTAGCAVANGVCRAFGGPLRCVLADTDAVSAVDGVPFVLFGGDRLSGRGAGGNIVSGRLAAEDSVRSLDDHLKGVRLVVIVTALGGGTGGGATLEVCKYLKVHGVPSIVFATMPFRFEGEDCQRNARGVMSMIEDVSATTFFIPLDKLVGDAERMDDAMRRAVDTLAGAVTLFWRLVEKPGYLRLDVERIRRIASGAGRGRFAVITTRGEGRAEQAVDTLLRSELLATAAGSVKSALCGILAGEDLLLAEVGRIADGIRGSFDVASFDLATVNDEDTFSGRISVVVMLFEAVGKPDESSLPGSAMNPKRRKPRGVLAVGPTGRGRFNKVEPTIWNGEDLDVPTFIRRGISIDM